MVTHSSILAGKIPWTEEPGGLWSMWLQRVRQDWSDWAHTYTLSQSVSSVTQLCPTLCDPMNHSTPGLPVHHQLREFTQTHVHWVSDAIQPSHPLLSSSPPAPNPSQHQSLFQWVNSSHKVAKVLVIWKVTLWRKTRLKDAGKQILKQTNKKSLSSRKPNPRNK